MTAPNNRERILPRLIDDEIKESFINYSMSVIVSRALPDVRDGLKPVHRRVVYAMRRFGIVPGRPHNNSATVVGDVLGRYDPPGHSSASDALGRLVLDFARPGPELRKFVKGPDFPTAGFIYGRQGIKDYQDTGRGRIVMRARAVIEEKESSNKAQIVVTEVPYQVNPDKLLLDIVDLVKNGKLTGI